jgi:hypothetical protein
MNKAGLIAAGSQVVTNYGLPYISKTTMAPVDPRRTATLRLSSGLMIFTDYCFGRHLFRLAYSCRISAGTAADVIADTPTHFLH